MSKSGMNRRQFLHTTAVTAAGAAAAGTGTVLVDPKGAWAMSLQALDEHTATTLVLVARELYPHDRLGDIYYAKVVESLDGKAVANKDVGKLLADGVAELDKTEGAVKWLDLSPGYRLASLKQLEATPFFQTVRGECITGIYNTTSGGISATRGRPSSSAAISSAASTISAGCRTREGERTWLRNMISAMTAWWS